MGFSSKQERMTWLKTRTPCSLSWREIGLGSWLSQCCGRKGDLVRPSVFYLQEPSALSLQEPSVSSLQEPSVLSLLGPCISSLQEIDGPIVSFLQETVGPSVLPLQERVGPSVFSLQRLSVHFTRTNCTLCRKALQRNAWSAPLCLGLFTHPHFAPFSAKVISFQ